MLRLLRALIAPTLASLGLAACAGDAPVQATPADATASEGAAQAFVAAMKPRHAGRPLVVVLASNDGTEITDLLLPHAVLKRSGLVDVQIVAPRQGAVTLYPALQIEATQDFASFDRAHPAGADYVVVPAMVNDDDPAVTGWLRRQAGQGARVIGVCVGALVVGRAGLLDGRRYTSHWYELDKLSKRHPSATYVPNQRYVVDRGVATTTGITASVPAMLALVEAIGGRPKAQALAAELGVAAWGPAHDSALFGLNAGRAWSYALNKAAFWRHERWTVEVHNGSDAIALALAVDAWSRTGRVSVAASASGPVTLDSGLVLTARPAATDVTRLPLSPSLKPMQQLDRSLCEIGERFGTARRDWVMQEMEYPGTGLDCATALRPQAAR